MGNTQYHLQALEKEGKIRTRRATLYRHYFPAAIFDERLEIILGFMRQETSRDILIYLLEHPSGATQHEIAEFKGFSAPTINWHMSRLMDSGLVTSRKEGRTVRYTIKKDLIEEITTLLKTYHPTIWTKLAGRLAELFLELSSRKEEK